MTDLREHLVYDGRMDVPRTLDFGDAVASVFSVISPVKKASNEDCVAALPLPDGRRVLIVADGVGGMPAGQHASRIAIDALADNLRDIQSEDALREPILDAIEHAHQRILERSDGSATTLAVVEVAGHVARTYHVGDSEILFFSGLDGLLWKSLPHSPVGYGVESGLLDRREALFNEARHLVSNVLGGPPLCVEINGPFHLDRGNTLLVASDGLFDNLHVEEILQRLSGDDLHACASDLVLEARRRMTDPTSQPCKPDDLTLALYRWNDGARP